MTIPSSKYLKPIRTTHIHSDDTPHMNENAIHYDEDEDDKENASPMNWSLPSTSSAVPTKLSELASTAVTTAAIPTSYTPTALGRSPRQSPRRSPLRKPANLNSANTGNPKPSKFLIHSGPLTSTRDPLRNPILSHTPFTPRPSRHPKSVLLATTATTTTNAATFTTDDEQNQRNDREQSQSTMSPKLPIQKSSSVFKNSNNPNHNSKVKQVLPAYAYKNAKSGLLEISELVPPSPSKLAILKNHSKTKTSNNGSTSKNDVDTNNAIDPATKTLIQSQNNRPRPALYPIALNGGAVGVYTHPSEFGMNTSSTFTSVKDRQSGKEIVTYNNNTNLQTIRSRRVPLNSHIAFPSEIRNSIETVITTHAASTVDGDMNVAMKSVGSNKRLYSDIDHNCQDDGDALHQNQTYPTKQNYEYYNDDNRIEDDDPWKQWERIHIKMTRLATTETTKSTEASTLSNPLKRQKCSLVHEDDNNDDNSDDDDDDLLHFDKPCNLHSYYNKTTTARISSVYNQDDFDFAIVLAPQRVYQYWAKHLDFRGEHFHAEEDDDKIGENYFYNDLEGGGNYNENANNENTNIGNNDNEPENSVHSNPVKAPDATTDTINMNDEAKNKLIYNKWEHTISSALKMRSPFKSRRITENYKEKQSEEDLIDEKQRKLPENFTSVRTLLKAKKASVNSSGKRVFNHRKSLFERAMGVLTPPQISSRFSFTPQKASSSPNGGGEEGNQFNTTNSDTNKYSASRRRWGNLAAATITRSPMIFEPSSQMEGKAIPTTTGRRPSRSPVRRNLMSPPINSISDTGISFRTNTSGSTLHTLHTLQSKLQSKSTLTKTVFLGSTSNTTAIASAVATSNTPARSATEDDESDDECHFTSQVIPRGIAARTNGMQFFLQALHRGIVVRRHVEGGEAEFISLKSVDGGDTISYQYVPPEEARVALLEQRVRFNRNKKYMSKVRNAEDDDRWNLFASSNSVSSPTNNKNLTSPTANASKSTNILPNHIIAEYQSRMTSSRIFSTISDFSTKFIHSGLIHAKDVIAVHPARHEDPFKSHKIGNNGEPQYFGTWTLRRSKTPHRRDCSFSLILPQTRMKDALYGTADALRRKALGNFNPMESSNSEKWYSGRGSMGAFRTLDLEAATEGEYWIIFRGFLLLHRDAASGRFATQRASGFSSHYNRKEDEERRQTQQHKKTRRTYEEDEQTNTCFPIRPPWKKSIENQKPIVAPPSDYFLGFKSEGTQIWSRLRQAGLETQRIYGLDTKKVMIKVRCPADRLQDVAEVLKIKLRNVDGSFMPFQESMASQFMYTNESNKQMHQLTEIPNLFRSSDRQSVIDFIIRSRIRDSGAELGERSNLGKQIKMRVPLHMHAKLESLYSAWVMFWHESNWIGRDGRSMTVENNKHKNSSKIDQYNIPMGDCHLKSSSKNATDTSIPSFFTRFFLGSFYQPLDSIQEYFGEGVAFYFAWLQHCTFHLVFLSVMGIIVTICQIWSHQWDHPLRPYFSVIVMLWGLFVMITWRRRSNLLAHKWGTLNYEEEETTRPQFKGEYRRCEITQEWIVHYPSWKRWLKYCFSFPLTLAFTVLSTIGILMVHANRDLLLARYFETKDMDDNIETQHAAFALDLSMQVIGKKAPLSAFNLTEDVLRDPTFWIIVGGFPSILGLSYPLLNFILMKISVILNDFENYRTETEYRNNLVLKVFSFRFACYFSSLYYYSFLLPDDSKEATDNAIFRVATNLIVYLTMVHWWNVFVVIYAPLLLHRWKLQRERSRLKLELRSLDQMRDKKCDSGVPEKDSMIEKQISNRRVLLEQAQDSVWEEIMLPSHNSFYDYLLAVVQFGYVTCFSVVLPIAPLLCLINNLMSMRLDAYKLCRGRRRPLVTKAGGIGIWEHVLHIVTVISILTNCSLMALTSKLGKTIKEDIGEVGLFFVVVGWEHLMLLIKYVIQTGVPIMPKSVINDKVREKYRLAQKNRSEMRAKKERRSGGSITKLQLPRERIMSSEITKEEVVENRPPQNSFHVPKMTVSTQTKKRSKLRKSVKKPEVVHKTIHSSPPPGVKEMVKKLNSVSHDSTSHSPIRSWKRNKNTTPSPKADATSPLQTLRRRASRMNALRINELNEERSLSITPRKSCTPKKQYPNNNLGGNSSANSLSPISHLSELSSQNSARKYFPMDTSLLPRLSTAEEKAAAIEILDMSLLPASESSASLDESDMDLLNELESVQSSLFGEQVICEDEDDDDNYIADLDSVPYPKERKMGRLLGPFYDRSDSSEDMANEDDYFVRKEINNRLVSLDEGDTAKWVGSRRRRKNKP